MLLVDLFAFGGGKQHRVSLKEAAGWSLAGLYPVSFERASLRVIEHDAVLVRTPSD